jgi:hypothetical protein
LENVTTVSMKSVSDIFSAFGGPSAVARVLRVKPSTASEMKRRGSIPAEYWRDLVDAAESRAIGGITAMALAEIHARPSGKLDGLAEPERPGFGSEGDRRGSDVLTGSPGGHFSRFRHLRRLHFTSAGAIDDHVAALREEWDRR